MTLFLWLWGSLISCGCLSSLFRGSLNQQTCGSLYTGYPWKGLDGQGCWPRDALMLQQLRQSKTDHIHKGIQNSLGSNSDPNIFPICTLRQYCTLRGEGDGLLFCQQDDGPLTNLQFWSVMVQALQCLGLVGVKFGTHCFRIGATSTVAAMGYKTSSIQRMRCWTSFSYEHMSTLYWG